jgi:CRISPR-associated protein Csb2
MAAVWKRKLHSEPLVTEPVVARLFGKLAGPPVFKLPRASLGHTRHYMPWFKKGPEDRTLVFDAFVVLDPAAEVVFAWPQVTLEHEERQAVSLLLSQLGYFGRAESWCSARALENGDLDAASGRTCGWLNVETGEVPEDGQTEDAEPVRVLTPDPQAWSGWSYGRKAVKPDPPWNLLAETADLQRERWSDPPGSRWLTYLRPLDAFAVEPKPRKRVDPGPVSVVRYALDGKVLPLLTETLYVAETARRYVQGMFGKRFEGEASPVFSGRGEDGAPKAGHRHAFFLPTDEDGDGRLDHLTMFALDEFRHGRELAVLDGFPRMRGPGGTDLSLVLLGVGGPEDFNGTVPILAKAARWRSVTPLVPTRHYKRRGTKRDACSPEEFPETALREEIARRGLPEPASIRRLPRCGLWDHRKRKVSPGRDVAWIKFRRERLNGGGRRGSDPGGGFEIEFAEPVRGPLAFGYACHYGLGLFAPAE